MTVPLHPRIRVLLADDHPVFRHGLHDLLEDTQDVEVVGEAGTGEEAVRLATELEPDVVVMDVKLPGMSGIEASRRLLEVCPSARILVLTMFQDDGTVFAAMRAGARGYVLKDADKDDLLRAVQSVARGEAIFSRPSPRGCWSTSVDRAPACRAQRFRR